MYYVDFTDPTLPRIRESDDGALSCSQATAIAQEAAEPVLDGVMRAWRDKGLRNGTRGDHA